MIAGQKKLSDHDMVLVCIQSGLKAIDIASYLDVNPSSITKIQSRKIRSFKPKLHDQLVLLCEFVKIMHKDPV